MLFLQKLFLSSSFGFYPTHVQSSHPKMHENNYPHFWSSFYVFLPHLGSFPQKFQTLSSLNFALCHFYCYRRLLESIRGSLPWPAVQKYLQKNFYVYFPCNGRVHLISFPPFPFLRDCNPVLSVILCIKADAFIVTLIYRCSQQEISSVTVCSLMLAFTDFGQPLVFTRFDYIHL